jgi:hypothetical protein
LPCWSRPTAWRRTDTDGRSLTRFQIFRRFLAAVRDDIERHLGAIRQTVQARLLTIATLQAAGKTTLRAIAAGLNGQRIPTSRGADDGTAVQVMRVLKRIAST